MYHSPPGFLAEGKNSIAYYSIDKPKTLIVFVHGFKGVSIATWDDFASLLIVDPAFSNCDVLFYGYESLKGQAFDQSQELLKFINKNQKPSSPFRKENPDHYNKIIIAAHSLGAIVSRYCLLEAISSNFQWRHICKLVLFAPAHNGARVQNLVMASIPGFFKVFGGLTLFLLPIVDDLKPDSQTITILKQTTNHYRGTAEERLLSAMVVHAFGDKVVHNAPFCFDISSPDSPVREQSHMSICKPSSSTRYLIPLDLIKNEL